MRRVFLRAALPLLLGLAFLGIEDWKFKGIVKIGDTIRGTVEVAEARERHTTITQACLR